VCRGKILSVLVCRGKKSLDTTVLLHHPILKSDKKAFLFFLFNISFIPHQTEYYFFFIIMKIIIDWVLFALFIPFISFLFLIIIKKKSSASVCSFSEQEEREIKFNIISAINVVLG
jgi:hypothetical protein